VPCGGDHYPNVPGHIVKAQRRAAEGGFKVRHPRIKKDRRMFSKRPNVPLEDVLYWGASGNDADILEEAEKFSANVVHFKDTTWSRFFADWDACCEVAYKPLDWNIVIENLLELNTGVGVPWKQDYHNKGEMIADFTQAGLVEYLQSLENAVINDGYFPEFSWDVFSKLDKYKKSKLDNNRLRTIQGGDVILLILMLRWISSPVKHLYDRHNRFYVVADNHAFAARVTAAFADSYTCGLDATGFDRGVPATVMERLLTDLCDKAGCPDQIIAVLIQGAVYGPLQLPSGELLSRFGGNPSGIFLTTIFNCGFNDLLHIEVYGNLFGPKEFDRYVHWVVTGDDAEDGFRKSEGPPSITPEVLVEAFSEFGLEYKVDLLEGDYYPPIFGCHAPYLSKVSVIRAGFVIPVPVEPRRNLGWYHTIDPAKPLSKQYDSITGMRESLLPFMICSALDPTYEVPTCVEDFFDDASGILKGRDVMGLKQAVGVYGTAISELVSAGYEVEDPDPCC